MATTHEDGSKPARRRPVRVAAAGCLLGLATIGVVYSCRTESSVTEDASLRDAAEKEDGAGDAPPASGDGSPGDAPLASGDGATGPAGSRLPEVPAAQRTAVTSERITNREASVPPQCYTKTEGRYNPCYVCHQQYRRREDDRLNMLDDGALQGSYNFSDLGEHNHWHNLFVDRSDWVARIDDDTIRAYVDEDNYSGLAARLRVQGFEGFIPDLADYQEGAAAFDERGLAKDGSDWVAFNYKPFPGTFWPTNGATDDVLVRMAPPFRELSGEFDRDVYYVNLTLAELTLKRMQRATLWPIEEKRLGVDLDGDGALGRATEIAARATYIGDAADVPIMFQQLPEGTEVMHSVRYIGVDDDGRIYPPRRMKELRYMRKINTLPRDVLIARYADERKEKRLGELPKFLFRGDAGFDNGQGWYVQGFVEDYAGRLRPQSYEEGVFCMGCHSAIGTTTDSTFSFVRKITGGAGWGYIDLVGMEDAPSVAEPGGEILNYLKRAGGGDEFRENPEMIERWFAPDGTVDEDKVAAADVYTLIAPTPARALRLNKAYTHIVRHQSFIQGRDPTVEPARNVFEAIDQEVPPLAGEYRYYGWDARVAWSR